MFWLVQTSLVLNENVFLESPSVTVRRILILVLKISILFLLVSIFILSQFKQVENKVQTLTLYALQYADYNELGHASCHNTNCVVAIT